VRIDTDLLNRVVRENIETLCRHFFPAGVKKNGEWLIADISGEKGESLGICLRPDKAGLWLDRANGESGTFIKLLKVNRSLKFPEAAKQISGCIGVNFEVSGTNGNTVHSAQSTRFDWSELDKLSTAQKCMLADWRGYSPGFVDWLDSSEVIRIYDHNNWATPIITGTTVAGCHYRPLIAANGEKVDWLVEPSSKHGGPGMLPLVIGDLNKAFECHVFESTWDMLAACDKLRIHEDEGSSALCTRGSSNGKQASQIPEKTKVYAWMQNDAAAETWFDKLRVTLRNPFYRVDVPKKFKDLNDWIRDGAIAADLSNAVLAAKLIEVNPSNTPPNKAEEYPVINWPEHSSGDLSGRYVGQKVVYPPDSILEDYMDFVRFECESADAFILGSILPVCGALLARRVRFPWGSTVKFPNIFAMLAGAPGDRKSSAIELADNIAKECLTSKAFLPRSFSPETLFDEYDINKEGRADKIWICDDANIVLTDWRQTGNGERVASRFLSLYDCGALTESFRRNKDKNQPETKRVIDQTSTSVVFGATFSQACFQGQAIRAGIARRFQFYVAEGHGRLIEIPDETENHDIVVKFSVLSGFSAKMGFSPEAEKLWREFQRDNRERIKAVDIRNEAESHRLSSEPIQVLKVAMIFQSCVCAKQHTTLSLISKDVLTLAIEHLAANLDAASFLDSIADRESCRNNAEILLAKIRNDFRAESCNGSIFLRRNDITCKYAPHSGRQGAWTPNDIFFKFLQILVRQGDAVLHEKRGKLEIYAFRNSDDQ
jgi:hypothetical protein